jgi:hypothetical protein
MMKKTNGAIWSVGLGILAFTVGRAIIYPTLVVISSQIARLWLTPEEIGNISWIFRKMLLLSEWLPYWLWGGVAGIALYYGVAVRTLSAVWVCLLLGLIGLLAFLHIQSFDIGGIFSIELLPLNVLLLITLACSFILLQWMLKNLSHIRAFVENLWVR